MTDCILVSDFKDCPVCSRATCSKENWFTTSFCGGGWAESCGAYGVGISNEILKPKRVMPAEELGFSSCLLCGRCKLQIVFLKSVCCTSLSKNGSLLQLLGSLHPAAALCAAMAALCIYVYASVNSFIFKWKVVCAHNNPRYWNKSQSVKNAGILLISFNPVYCFFFLKLLNCTYSKTLSVSCSTCLVFFV